jgi:hypothetical protein
MNKQERYNQVFRFAVGFVGEMRGKYPELKEDVVFERNFISQQEFNALPDACCRLFSSLQNRGMMPSVIKFDKKREAMSDILFGYDPKRILKKYNSDELLSAFEGAFGPIANLKSQKNLWRQFSKGIISGSVFMSSFKDKEDFDDFIKTFNHNKYTKAALPMLLSKEISGLGFALACDFLKELGYRDYPKPDVHLIDIFYRLGLSDSKEPYDVYKSMIEMTEELVKENIRVIQDKDMDAYVVDKIFWMIGSGKIFPGSDKNMGGDTVERRNRFISEAGEVIGLG